MAQSTHVAQSADDLLAAVRNDKRPPRPGMTVANDTLSFADRGSAMNVGVPVRSPV